MYSEICFYLNISREDTYIGQTFMKSDKSLDNVFSFAYCS